MKMFDRYGFKDGKEIYFTDQTTDAEIGEALKNGSLEYLYFNEDETESGRSWECIWYDPEEDVFVWQEGSQARASDGGFCWDSAVYELGRNADFLKLIEGD